MKTMDLYSGVCAVRNLWPAKRTRGPARSAFRAGTEDAGAGVGETVAEYGIGDAAAAVFHSYDNLKL